MTNMKLQEEEVESVLWMDYRECLKHIRKEDMDHCIFPQEFERLVAAIEDYFARTGRPLGRKKITETWAEDAQVELEDWIEEQGIYIRQ